MNFLDLAIKSILAGTVGWATLCLLRRSSASTRHITLFLTLIGVSLLPIISLFVPRWYVPFLKLTEAAPTVAEHSGSSFSELAQSAAAPVAVGSTLEPMTMLFVVWLSIAALLCLRVLVKLVTLSRAERNLAMSIDPGLQALVAERCRESGRHVLLLEGLDKEPPMTWGHYRPVLVLPGDARSWPEDRLNSVVLHELAHIERGDWLASMFAQVACAVYWFNPFVWVIRKQMEIESETAADDRVLSMGISATQYASHLVAVSKDLIAGRSSTQVALAMARPGKLDRRIRAILESQRSRRTLRGSMTLALAATIVSIAGVLAAAAPTVVHHAKATPPDVLVTSRPIASEDEPDKSGTPDNGLAAAEQGNLTGKETPPTDSITTSNEVQSTDSNTETAVALSGKLAQVSPQVPFLNPHPDHRPNPHPEPHPSLTPNPLPSTNPRPHPSPNPHPQPHPGALAKSGNVDLNIDMNEISRELREAGSEADAATKDAMKSLASSGVTNREFIEGLSAFTKATTKLALENATKVTKAQIQAALKEVKKVKFTPQTPPAKHQP